MPTQRVKNAARMLHRAGEHDLAEDVEEGDISVAKAVRELRGRDPMTPEASTLADNLAALPRDPADAVDTGDPPNPPSGNTSPPAPPTSPDADQNTTDAGTPPPPGDPPPPPDETPPPPDETPPPPDETPPPPNEQGPAPGDDHWYFKGHQSRK